MNTEEKARLARQLIARFNEIESLPRAAFPPARRGQAPAAPTPDSRAVHSAYLGAAIAGIGRFDRAGRAQAKARAEAAANEWLAATFRENERRRLEHQHALDEQWARLMSNDPAAVLPALDAALADGRPPIAVVGLEGATVSLAVAVPSVEDVPDRRPARTDAGNLSLKRLSKTEINSWYLQWVAGHVLLAAKRAFAAAPGLGTAHVVAVGPSRSDGALLAASIPQDALAQLRGERANAMDILTTATDHVLVRMVGSARALAPLEILDGTELREVRAALTRRPTPARVPTVTTPAYARQPSAHALQSVTSGPRDAAPRPAEWVGPPPRSGRRRKIGAGLVAGLLALGVFGWLGSLGSDESLPRHVVARASLPGSEAKKLTVRVVTSTGLVRLVDPAGEVVDVRLTHTLRPAPGDCLGQESAESLKALLPVGTVVSGAETGELSAGGVLVAAELARQGLAVVEPLGAASDAEYRAIAAAQEEARAAQAGMYSPATACTVPAQVAAYMAATAGVSTEADGIIALAVLDQAQLDVLTTHIDEATRTAPMLAALLAGSDSELPLAAFTPAEIEGWRSQVSQGDAVLAATVTRTDDRIAAENTRLQAEAEAAAAAAAAEAQRVADAQAAREAAAAQPQPVAALEPWNLPGPDLDCADIGHRVYITGPDYHRLDRDGDGVGCDSWG